MFSDKDKGGPPTQQLKLQDSAKPDKQTNGVKGGTIHLEKGAETELSCAREKERERGE